MGSNCCKGDHAGRPARSGSSIYTRSRAGASLDGRFTTSEDAKGVTLTVASARTGDSGVYTLQASNAAGKDTARVRLEVSPDEEPVGEDPPTFLRRLQDLTVKVGTRTRFLVEILSSTECKVTWYRNERRLMEAERIALARDGNFWCADVAAVSVDDAGRWTCSAENAGGRASCSAHLNVLVPKAYKRPEFVEELRALLTEQGTVSLECKVVGVPTPVLRWFKDSCEIKAGDVFALTANAEDPTSLGTYTCEAVNCMGRAYSSSKVHVVGRDTSRPGSGGLTPEPPPIFTKELEGQFVKISCPLTLSCHIVVPPWPRSVVWYNKEGKVDPSERYHVIEDGVGGYLIEVVSAEYQDEGEWKCVATSAGGRVGISTCYVTMDVPKNYRKPRFMENLQAVLTEEGLVSFECKVVGFPTPVLSWFKDGQELKPGDVYQLTGTNSLGSYCCIARNCMGQASSSAELTVEDIQNQLNEEEKLQLFSKNQAPKFVQGLKSVEAKIDEPFRFTIKVAIPPEPSVLWYRDDQPVDESTRCHLSKEERGGFGLDITNLEFLDQAEWKCVAMNDFGHSVTSCFLKLIIPRHYKKPRFLENLQAILSDEGAVNLECKVIGVPQPILKWYKDGEELKPGDIHRIISGQDGTCCLGTYTCEARNCMGIAASSASLLGFEESMKQSAKKKAEEQALQRNLSLSTIHEERTSQMYDTPVGDITLDDKGEISFSFDGKEVSVSLYETPDLTEEEALQIVEMYADQLSENVTEHNVVELPPLRFVKETSTSGNLLMEAIIIDVSPEYFASPEEDLRTEADVEEISIADESLLVGVPQLSLDLDIGGEDYLDKTLALMTDEKADIPKKLAKLKSESMKSGEDFFSLSRDPSLTEDKDDDTQVISESELRSYESAHSISKAKPLVKTTETVQPPLQDPLKTTPVIAQREEEKLIETGTPVLKPKRERRTSRSSRRSSSGSEKSVSRAREELLQRKAEIELPTRTQVISDEEFKLKMTELCSSIEKVINDVQIIEREIILKSELMSSAATASRSLEIISSLITPFSEIHSIAEASKESALESKAVCSSLITSLPQSLKALQQSLTIIEKCIDVESETKTLVKKTCVAFIETCGSELIKIMSSLNSLVKSNYLTMDDRTVSDLDVLSNDIIHVVKFTTETIKTRHIISEAIESKQEEPSVEAKHLRDTQKAVFELKSPLSSLLCIAESAEGSKVSDVSRVKSSEVILTDMSASIQDLQSALEQIELLSVKESTSSLHKYNTEIIESVVESVLNLRSSFEQLYTETKSEDDKTVLIKAITSIKQNLSELSLQINTIESNIGTFDILQSDNKLEVLQKMAQILIALENNISRLETLPEIKTHISVFHKNLTKVLEKVIDSNDAKKYIALIEICDVVNRINSSIKNIDSDTTLSLASLSNTMKIIKDHFVKNIFDSELNCAILSNITDVYVSIQEALSQAEEMSVTIDSEHIEDLSSQTLDVTKANVAVEHIEQTIAAINNIKIIESTGILKTTYSPFFEKICPILEELKQNIGSVRSSAPQTEEHVSELSDIAFARSFATPVCELHKNIIVLSRLVTENVESLKENSTISLTVAEPLQELRSTLEILQQDVISQYKEDVMPLEVSTQIANAVQDLHSCILMIEEKAEVEGAEELSTLEDISGIKTTAETIPSDRLVLPSAEETAVQSSLEPLIEPEAPSATAKALQSLNDHITILQNQDVIDALDTLSEVSDYSSLKSVALGLGDLHSGIEEILHPVIMENAIELKSTLNTSKLSAIAEPMQDLQQSLSILDTTNIPIYEHILEMSSDKIHSVFQSIFEFKERLDKCIQAVFPAMETADKTIEISNKVEALRGVCENLKNIIESTKLSSPETPVNEEVFTLEDTINSLLDATDVTKGIKIELVKSITEELFAKALTAKEEIIKFTPQTTENLLQEAKFIQTIDEVESNIAVLEQYDFVDLSRTSDLTTCTSPHLAIEFETSSLQQMSDVVENAVNVLQDADQGKSEADFMIVDDFFRTCKNEFTIIKLLLSKKMSHKRIIRLLQEFVFLQRTVSDFKCKQAELNLSEEMNDHVSTFLANANECLEKVQESLTTVVESQSNLLFDVPVKKLKEATESLKEVKKCRDLEPILDVIVCLENVIRLAIPFIQNQKEKVIEEIKHVDLGTETINVSLAEKMEDFEILVQETALYSLNDKSNFIVRNLQTCIQKHTDYKEATKSGKALIISKCLAECLGIILEKEAVTMEPSEIIIVEHKAEESALKLVLTEMIVPLQTLHNQLIYVQEQISSGVEEDAISVDMTSTESVINTMTEICKDVIQIREKINEGAVIDHDDIALVMEVDKEIQTISDSIKQIESIPAVKEIREALKPVEQIEKSLQVILSSEAVGADKKPRLSKEKSTELIQHIDQYIELTEIVEEMSAFIREEQIKESVNIARELRESIAASEDINIEGGGEVSSEVRTEQARLAQQLHEALSTLQVHAIERAHEIGQPVSEKTLLRITETASQLQTNLVAVASIDSAVTDTTTISSETLKATLDDSLTIEHVEPLTSLKEDTYEAKEITKLEDELVKASEAISEKTSEIEKRPEDQIAAQAPLELKVLTEHIDELLSEKVSETVKILAETLSSEHLKGFLEVAKEIRVNISALETVSEPLEATKLIEETVTCQNVLKQEIQQSLSSLENVILESAQEEMPTIKSEDLIQVKDIIMHIQEDLDVAIPSTSKDYEIVSPDKSTPEVSMTCLQDLLQSVNDKINLPPEEQSPDDMDYLVDILDEVQTVLIKLKCDYDGAGNDTLNETLEDLECSVRSFQLQINEESSPIMLQEACVTLQLLASTMSEAYESNKACLKADEGTALIDKCVGDSEESLKLIDLAASIRTEQLENIVSGLDNIKENMKSLKSRFMGQAENIIESGIDIIQRLNQIEDQVFSLEKDLESTEKISAVVRDSVVAAVHSVYGSISNMRSTISSIQKKYMYENYGKPSENLLHSIKNATLISKAINNDSEKVAWKNLSRSLRNTLNHFEDIKFYINFDKTARLPSDAAFTKIILDELNSNISATVCLFDTSKTEDSNNFENLLKSVKDIQLEIETRTTLEVKEKIPMLKHISFYILAVTEGIKLSITSKQISTDHQVEQLPVQLAEEKESTEIIAEALLDDKQEIFEAAVMPLKSEIAANDLMTTVSESIEHVYDIDTKDIIELFATNTCVEETIPAIVEEVEKDEILEFKEISEKTQVDDQIEISELEEDQAEKERFDEARAIDSTVITDEDLPSKDDIREESELGLDEKVAKIISDTVEEKTLLTETIDTTNEMLSSSENVKGEVKEEAVPHTETSDVSEKILLGEARAIVTTDKEDTGITTVDKLQEEPEKDQKEIIGKEHSEEPPDTEIIETADAGLLTSDNLEESEKEVKYIDSRTDTEKECLEETLANRSLEIEDEDVSTTDKFKEETKLKSVDEVKQDVESEDKRGFDIDKDSAEKPVEHISSSDLAEKEFLEVAQVDESMSEAKTTSSELEIMKELEKDLSDVAEKEKFDELQVLEDKDKKEVVLSISDKVTEEIEKDLKETVVEDIDSRDVVKTQPSIEVEAKESTDKAEASDQLKEVIQKDSDKEVAEHLTFKDSTERECLEVVQANEGIDKVITEQSISEIHEKNFEDKVKEHEDFSDIADKENLDKARPAKIRDEEEAASSTSDNRKDEIVTDSKDTNLEYIKTTDTADAALSVSDDLKQKDLQKMVVEESSVTKCIQAEDSSQALTDAEIPENVDTDFELKKVADEETLTNKEKSPFQILEAPSDEAVKVSSVKSNLEVNAEVEDIVISEVCQETKIVDSIDKKPEPEEKVIRDILQDERETVEMVEKIKSTTLKDLDEVETVIQFSESIESQEKTIESKDKAESVQGKIYDEAVETHEKQKGTLFEMGVDEEVAKTDSKYDKAKDEKSLKLEAKIIQSESTSEEVSPVTEKTTIRRKDITEEEEKLDAKISESLHKTEDIVISDIDEKPSILQAIVQQKDSSIDKIEFASSTDTEMIEKQMLVSQTSESQKEKERAQTEIKVIEDQIVLPLAKDDEKEVFNEEVKSEDVLHLDKTTDFEKATVQELIPQEVIVIDKKDELISVTIDTTSDATETISAGFQGEDKKVLPDKDEKVVSSIDKPQDEHKFEAAIEGIDKAEKVIVTNKEESDLVKHQQDLKTDEQEKLLEEQPMIEKLEKIISDKDLGAPKKEIALEQIEPQGEILTTKDKIIVEKYKTPIKDEKEATEQQQQKKFDMNKEKTDVKSQSTEIEEDIKPKPEISKKMDEILKKSICEEIIEQEQTKKAESLEIPIKTEGDTLSITKSIVTEKQIEDLQAENVDILKEPKEKDTMPDESTKKSIEKELAEVPVTEGTEKLTEVSSLKQKEAKKGIIKVSKKKVIKQKVDPTPDAYDKKEASEIEIQPDVDIKNEITELVKEQTSDDSINTITDKEQDEISEKIVDKTIAFGEISEKIEKTETVDVIKTSSYMQTLDKAEEIVESSLVTAEVVDIVKIITDVLKENADVFLPEEIVSKEGIQVQEAAEKEFEEFVTKTEVKASHLTKDETLKDSKKKALTEKEIEVEIATSEDKYSLEKVIEESNKLDVEIIEEKTFKTQEKIDAMPIGTKEAEDKKIKHEEKYDEKNIVFDTQDLEPKPQEIEDKKKDSKELDIKVKETEEVIDLKQKKSIELERSMKEKVAEKTDKTAEPEVMNEDTQALEPKIPQEIEGEKKDSKDLDKTFMETEEVIESKQKKSIDRRRSVKKDVVEKIDKTAEPKLMKEDIQGMESKFSQDAESNKKDSKDLTKKSKKTEEVIDSKRKKSIERRRSIKENVVEKIDKTDEPELLKEDTQDSEPKMPQDIDAKMKDSKELDKTSKKTEEVIDSKRKKSIERRRSITEDVVEKIDKTDEPELLKEDTQDSEPKIPQDIDAKMKDSKELDKTSKKTEEVIDSKRKKSIERRRSIKEGVVEKIAKTDELELLKEDTQDSEPKIPQKIDGKMKDTKELDKTFKKTEEVMELNQKISVKPERSVQKDVVEKTAEPEPLKKDVVKIKSEEIGIKKELHEKVEAKAVPKESVDNKSKDSKPSLSSRKTAEMISTEDKDVKKGTSKLTKQKREKETVSHIPDKPEKSDDDQKTEIIDENLRMSKSIETFRENEETITEVKELKTEKPKKIGDTLPTAKVDRKTEDENKSTEKVRMEEKKPLLDKERIKRKDIHQVDTKDLINGSKELMDEKYSKAQTKTISSTVTTEDYISEKHKEVDKPRFIDRTHKDYTSEFVRPSDYRDKQTDVDDAQLKTFGKNITIYKAQTIILDSQLRSSVPPQCEFSRSTESADRRSDIRRSKALSEARSVMSEKRTSMSRDSKRKPVFSTYLTDRTAVEGSRVKLTCSVLSSSDPKITWLKSGAPLDNKLKYRTKYVDGLITMEVLNAVPSDSAEYSCNVENDNGSVSTSAILKVYPSFEASPIPPTFTRSIRDTYHLAENELVLECRIRGQPLPTITWFKNDKLVGINERYQAYYLADGVCRLAITHPTPDDSGKYTCKAENSVWSDQITHVVNFTGKETRLSPNLSTVEKTRFNRHAMESRRPHFTNVLTDYKVAKGGTIGLQVEIKGFPTKVEWLREGQEVTEVYRNAKTFVEYGLYTLALADVTEKESGMYTCRAWSTHGNVDMNAAITVVQPNELDGKPAIIVGRPDKDILISVGEDVNISFRVQGEPKPKVVFMKGTRDITNSQRVCKMTSDDYVKFTLKRSVVSDAGTYCILTRNAYGCDRAFVTVEIRQRASSENLISDWTYPDDSAISISDRGYKSVPERIPGEPSVVDGGNNWVAISWTKPEIGVAAPVLAYKVESWLLGKEGGARWVELGITPLTAFDAFNLKQGELYHFRVTPRNRFGWGESSQTSKPVGIGIAGERPEFVDILPGQLKVLVGETANLTCSVKGKPVPEVVWMKNGHEVEEEEQRVSMAYNGSDCCLVIKNINEEDEARYSCEASNEHGRASTYARLAVVTDRQIWEADVKLKRERSSEVLGEFPPQFTMRLRDRRVQSTYPVRLTCQVVGNPNPSVTWFKDGQSVHLDNRRTESQDEHFHTLEIAPTNLEDGGVYEAMARNACGAVSCRCSLVVDKGIRAYVAPEFCCGLEPLYRLNEGEELRISAVVEAYPSVGVTWFRDGVRLRPSRRAIMTLDRDGQIELALAFVTVRDAGVYSCIASNEVGRATTSGKVEIIGDGLPLEKKRTPPMLFSPDVPYSQEPMFIRKPRSSEAREGDTVIIQCEVVGDPKPDVYWLRDFLKPDYYRDASHFKRVGTGTEYRFEIPHAKFDYTGTYSVIAKNVHGEAKAIISLQILAKDPSTSEDSHSVSYGRVDVLPGFERELTDLLCHDGDVVEFECRVTGQPTPDIKWFHYSDLIRDCDYLESSFEEGTARLKIKQVTGEDEGTYCCQASNNLGKAGSTACLVVYPPGEPNTLSQRLRRPPALSAASTPRSTPARSMSRATTPAPVQERRTHSPSRQVAPKFYTYPFNKVVDEGDCVSFQCAVKGLPSPWATWDKDGVIITPSARITIKEKDDMMRILEIDEVSIDDVGLYRITLENDYGRVEASARLEVISHKGKFYAGVKGYSPSPRRLNYRRRSSTSKQD